MKALLLMVPLIFTGTASAVILVIDLNNATGEVNACKRGAGADQVAVINAAANGGRPVNAAAVERTIADLESRGQCIDASYISGHDGNGEFFGGTREENGFSSADFREILARHPRTSECMKEVMGFGCYTGNLRGNENYWLNVSDNVRSTVSFPLQSRVKEDKENQSLVEEQCRPASREAMQNAVDKDQFCALYHRLPKLQNLQASICTKDPNHFSSDFDILASNLYNDETHHDDCYYKKDLYKRCESFDKDHKMRNTFDCFMAAERDVCRNPPPDHADEDTQPGGSILRKAHNYGNLYAHCVEQLKDQGYEMPGPTQVIRLIKFDQLKENLNRLNRRQIQEYDDRLEQLGLDQYKLGDLSATDDNGDPKDRRWVVKQINKANAALEQMTNERTLGADGTRPGAVWNMAIGLKAALVDLRYKQKKTRAGDCAADDAPRRCFVVCSHFSLVHEGITDPQRASECIISYKQGVALE